MSEKKQTYDELLSLCTRLLSDVVITEGFKGLRAELHIIYHLMTKFHEEIQKGDKK